MIRSTAVTPLALSLSVSLAACDLGVEPTNSVDPSQATQTISGVRAIVSGVYARLQATGFYGNNMLLITEIMADNARPSFPAIAQSRVAHYSNSIGSHIGNWNGSYVAINEINTAIASAEALVGAEPALANRYLGEGLFLRGLLYHDLARIYAYEPTRIVNGWDVGVVLRTAPTRTAGDADLRERGKVLETYQQIETDLRKAIPLLAQNGTTNPYFANTAAAEALLARVYLYWERWNDAIEYATDAMSHTSARLVEPGAVANMFRAAPNAESLFEINYDAATETLWVNDCTWCYTHPAGTWFANWPSAELLALFEPADARTALYPATTNGTRYVNKYTAARGAYTDNSPVLRFSEVLLIRAEAYAASGQEDLARADLTTLRAKRGVGPATATGAGLVTAIADERRRELAFEGHRWFDLKRRGMDITKPAYLNNATVLYTDFRILAGLPDDQVQNNAKLKQNPGY